MNDRLLQSRNRSILRLLRQNFPRVEGPLLDRSNRVFYRVWPDGASPEDRPGVEIEFPSGFLGEPGEEFGRCALEALRKAKECLNDSGAHARKRKSITVFRKRSFRLQSESIGRGPVEMLYTIKPF